MGENFETEVGNQESCILLNVKFEMLMECPNEEEAAGYTVLEFKIRSWRYTLEVACAKMVFKLGIG